MPVNPYAPKRPRPWQESKNHDDSFVWDDDVDWDAACVELDQKVAAAANTSGTTTAIVKNPSKILKIMRPTQWNKPAAGQSVASSSTNTNQQNSTAPTTLPSITTIRSATATTVTLARVPKDPRQVGLPSPLLFDPQDLEDAVLQDERLRELVQAANVSAPLLNGWTLYSHQKRAILASLRRRRMILALDMGLGKTLIGCVWAKAMSRVLGAHMHIICPVTLKDEWKRTAIQATGLVVPDEKKGYIAEKRGKNKEETVTENSDEEPQVSIYSWQKVPAPDTERQYVVVADEAHSMQSMTAARTKDMLKLVLHKNCCGVLLLSGTPMKNGKPTNLFPLLRAIRHPLGRHQRAYEAHFCAGKERNFGRGPIWQAIGAANLTQLRQLTSTHLLHLTKEDCLKDLPPQTRKFHQIAVSSRQQLKHLNALRYVAKVYETNQTTGDDGKAILGAVQELRMVGSFAKVEATVSLAQNVLQTQDAIVIFTDFVKVAKMVHEKLAAAGWASELLTGETRPSKRQELVDRFQQGISPVFVSTFGAGGVGLTLTAAHTIVLLDRPWTPGDALQAEDRVRRIGQNKPVTSIWMRAFDMDQQIDEMIAMKQQTTAAVLTDKGGFDDPSGAPRLSIMRALKELLPAIQHETAACAAPLVLEPVG